MAGEMSSRGTTWGTSAVMAGFSKAWAAPTSATRVKMLDRLCQPPMLPRARPATPAAFTTSHTITTRRRSQRSATCPTTKVRSTMGTNCTRPTRPRSRALPVRLYSCHPTATPSIWKPTLARTREEERKANGGWRRSDRDDEGISTPLAVGAGEHRVQQDIDARRGVVELGVLRFVVRDTVSARREDHGGGSHPRDVVRVVSRLAQDVPMGHAEHLRGLADEAHAARVEALVAELPLARDAHPHVGTTGALGNGRLHLRPHAVGHRAVRVAHVAGELGVLGEDTRLVRPGDKTGHRGLPLRLVILPAYLVDGHREHGRAHQGIAP